MSNVEYYWSSFERRNRPLHKPEIVEKAVKTANFRQNRCQTHFLTPPPKFEDEPVHPGQRVWFCNALSALTRDEVIALYETLMATSKDCLETGGDFTSPDVKALYPHIYADALSAADGAKP